MGLICPPLGTLVAVVVGGGWTALWFGMLGVSYALENNQVTLGTQMTILQQQAPLLLGFGIVAQFFAWLPLTVPLIVISATLLCCRLHRHGHCPLPTRDQWHQATTEETADAIA